MSLAPDYWRWRGCRRQVCIAFAAALAVLSPASTWAQEWPTKPVNLIVGYGAGGGVDQMARILAPKASDDVKQPFVVQNRPGGGGAVAAVSVKAAPADGHTLVLTTSTTFTFDHHFAKADFTMDDFRHVAIIGQFQEVFVSHPSRPWKTLQDAIVEAKAQNRDLKYASFYQLDRAVTAMIAKQSGVKITPVPTQGGAGVVNAVIADQVDFGYTGGTWGPSVTSGTIKLLASGPREPLKNRGEVPTLRKLGYDVETEVFVTVSVPKGTPDAVVRKLEATLKKAASDPAYAEFCEDKLQVRYLNLGEAETKKALTEQSDRYNKLVEAVSSSMR
jgi:tripartite-type tricarboxylate transporter receptor subunit TctC